MAETGAAESNMVKQVVFKLEAARMLRYGQVWASYTC